MSMKPQRFLWALTLCALTPALVPAQVKVDSHYEPYTPIVAECIATAPPDAQVQATWSVTGAAKLVQVSPLEVHLWAPPGNYDVCVVGMWLKTREVKLGQEKVQVLENFGLLNSKGTFQVGQPDPPTPPNPPTPPDPPTPQPQKLTAVVIEESGQRTPAQASVVLSPTIASWVETGGHKWYVFDRDAENAGRVPVCDSRGCRLEQRGGLDPGFKPFFDAARGKTLPRLVIAVQGQGKVLCETALPATASETLALLKKYGG
jgi:hypothetical protein